MKTKERCRHRFWQVAAGLLWVAVTAPGCTAPALEGHQVQAVPERFIFDANASKGRRVFPERVILSEGAWWGDIRSQEPQSDIFITRYEGNATMADARAAREVQASRYGNPATIDYGQVAPVTIDGRTAFAWMEVRYAMNGAIRSLDYKAVIPYDTTTYAVEFSTSAPERLHPDSLTAVVHSWGVAETVVHWNVIYGVAAVVAGLLLLLGARARRPRHHTEYRLWEPETDPESPAEASRTDPPPTPSDGAP